MVWGELRVASIVEAKFGCGTQRKLKYNTGLREWGHRLCRLCAARCPRSSVARVECRTARGCATLIGRGLGEVPQLSEGSRAS